MRRFPVILITVVMVIAVVAAVAVNIVNEDFKNSSAANAQSQLQPVAHQTTGVPAIQAHADHSLLTSTEVTAYVTTHPFIGGPTTTGASPQVVTLQLVTSKQAFSLTGGESIGVPDAVPVYYVVLHGPFRMVGVRVPIGTKIGTSNKVEEVFDAQTGNMLLWGEVA